MNVVQRARMLYYENSGYNFSNLKIFDVTQAHRTRSLQYLEQVTNLCQKIKLTPHSFQQEQPQNKLKFMQAYQYSLLYSSNLKKIYDQKQTQLDNKNKQLKEQIELKKRNIKDHKKKVEKRKNQFRDMKINKAKKTYKTFQKQMEQLKNKHNELHEIKVKLQQQIYIGRDHLLQNKFNHQVMYKPYSNQGEAYNPINSQNMQNNFINPKTNVSFQNPSYPQQRYQIYDKNPTTSSNNSQQKSYSKQQRHSQEIFDEQNKVEEIQSMKKINEKSQVLRKFKQKKQKQIKQNMRNLDNQLLDESLKPLSKISLQKKNSNLILKAQQQRLKDSFSVQKNKNNLNLGVSNKSGQDKQQEQDVVFDMDNINLSTHSRRLQSSKTIPPMKNSGNSAISKGSGDSSLIPSDDSIYKVNLNIDSNISNRNELINSNSGIESKQIESGVRLFNTNKIKRKDDDSLDDSLKKTIKLDYPQQSPRDKQVRISLTNGVDRNLWQSSKGNHESNQSLRLFNAPKKRSSQNYGSSQASLQDSYLQQKQQNNQQITQNKDKQIKQKQQYKEQNEDLDLDGLDFGLQTKESKIIKGSKDSVNKGVVMNKFELSKTMRLQQVRQEQQSQIMSRQNSRVKNSKQNSKVIVAPPNIKQTQQVDDYQQDYQQDYQDQIIQQKDTQLQQKQRQQKQIQQKQKQKQQKQNNYNKSFVKIQLSPNNSFVDIQNEQKQQQNIFCDLIQQKFIPIINTQINPSYSYQQKGIFIPVPSNIQQQFKQPTNKKQQSQNKKRSSQNIKQSYKGNHNQYKQSVTISQNDFFDDFAIPQQSNIGKRPLIGLKKTSKLNETSYNIQVLNNKKQVIFTQQTNNLKENKKQSNNTKQLQQEELLILNNSTLNSVIKPNNINKKNVQTINLIQSTTFNQNQLQSQQNQKQNQSISLLNLNQQPILLSNDNINNENKNNVKNSSMNLINLKDKQVLNSIQNDNNKKVNQYQQEQQVSEQINFELQQDSSKLLQFQKQQLQRKMIKIMRNRNKITQKSKINIIILNIDNLIQKQINQLIRPNQNNQQKQKQQQKDWKLIKKTFQNKIKQIKKYQKVNINQIQNKLISIQQNNNKIIQKIKLQKQIKSKSKSNKKQLFSDDGQYSDLAYSQSIIKDSKQKSQLNKKNLILNDHINQFDTKRNNQINNINSNSPIGDQHMTVSFKQKSIIGLKPIQHSQLNQNLSFGAESLYKQSNLQESDQFGSLELKQKSKFVKKNQQIISNQRQNVFMTNIQDKKTNQVSKSKYVKAVTPTAKSVGKQSAMTKIQQHKYVSIQDPLNNQISLNKKFGKKPIDDDQDDF